MISHYATLVADARCHTAEIPLWDTGRRQVIWTDIPNGRLFRLRQDGKWEQFFEMQGDIGGLTIQADDGLLLFHRDEVSRLLPDGTRQIVLSNEGKWSGRFNDTLADPEGRVFCGTMVKDKGALYRLDPDGAFTKICGGTNCSNGLGFSPDMTTLYWTNSSAKTIYAFDYEQSSGELTERRPFLKLEQGTPDGMTVDVEGCLWVAVYGESCVRRFSPQAECIEIVQVPAPRVTSCIFGGEALRDLYITTQGGTQGDPGDNPDGALYHVKPGAQGLPEFRSRIGLNEE